MIEQVSPRDLASWLRAAGGDRQPLLLDVREPQEWRLASVQIDGAELQQMAMHTIAPRLHELDPARPVAVLCHHGGRSMQVAMFLERQGFAGLINLAGGVAQWAQQVDPAMPQY